MTRHTLYTPCTPPVQHLGRTSALTFGAALAFCTIGVMPSFADTTLQGDDLLVVPSGLNVAAVDMRVEVEISPPQARFRYLMPELNDQFEYAQVSADLIALCQAHALPELGKIHSEIRQIVVSLSDRPVNFGEVEVDAVQVFEQFIVENDQCIWGEF